MAETEMCHVLLWVSSPDIRFNDNEIKRLLPLNEILIGGHLILWKIKSVINRSTSDGAWICIFVIAGCKDRPASPANALVKCSQYRYNPIIRAHQSIHEQIFWQNLRDSSGCTITCLEDHELPDQQRKMNLVWDGTDEKETKIWERKRYVQYEEVREWTHWKLRD